MLVESLHPIQLQYFMLFKDGKNIGPESPGKIPSESQGPRLQMGFRFQQQCRGFRFAVTRLSPENWENTGEDGWFLFLGKSICKWI